MQFPEDLLEAALKGAFVIAGVVAGLTLVGFFAFCLAPYAIGITLSDFFYFRHERRRIEEKRCEEYEEAKRNEALRRKNEEKKQAREQAESEERWRELTAEENAKKALEEKENPVLDKVVYRESDLTKSQQEELFAKKYKRLKISPDGKSGAAIYWINPRYNESKEHAFFCYLIEAELRKHVENLMMHVNYGPDVEFSRKGKRYVFEIETGSVLARYPQYVKRKFDHYQKKNAKVFILVTSKALKYKYAKFGKVITRATLKKTIEKIFKQR